MAPVSLAERFWDLLGSWQGVEEQFASPFAPGARTRAMLTFKQDLAGTAVVQDYRQVRSDRTEFAAHGVFLVDAAAADPVSWWLFDSYALPPVPATGGWRDGELVLSKTTERGRAVHRFGFDDETLTYAIDVAVGEADLQSFLRGRYVALSGH